MRLLATSYWSFARDRTLLREFRDLLESSEVAVHDVRSELDLNRTTLAVSGEEEDILNLTKNLSSLVFPRVDLARHVGAFPRTGALDELTFTPALDEPAAEDFERADALARKVGEFLSDEMGVPTYLCGMRGGSTDAELTRLREGGFGSLLDRKLTPDFGPSAVHPHLGIALVGAREFRLSFVATLAGQDLTSARGIASSIALLRSNGDERFLGVEAAAFRLPTAHEIAIIVDLTLPDLTPADPIIQWILEEATVVRTVLRLATLTGAIRTKDQQGSIRLVYKEQQVAW